MNIFNNIVFLFILLFSFNINAFPIPEKNKAVFDIIRKDKVIGKHEIFFSQKNGTLELETVINIDVKVLFFNAYKFRHESREIWKNENFIKKAETKRNKPLNKIFPLKKWRKSLIFVLLSI